MCAWNSEYSGLRDSGLTENLGAAESPLHSHPSELRGFADEPGNHSYSPRYTFASIL
jgi:hypothetical protein